MSTASTGRRGHNRYRRDLRADRGGFVTGVAVRQESSALIPGLVRPVDTTFGSAPAAGIDGRRFGDCFAVFARVGGAEVYSAGAIASDRLATAHHGGISAM
jgi:hypothetical protein